MKIILIHTPRSGSTSILRYFSALNPDYECFNDPWFEWMERYTNQSFTYKDILAKKNVFLESTYKILPVSLETVISDFEKVIFLLRKNLQEQVESYLVAVREGNFLNDEPRKYWVDDISKDEISQGYERFVFLNEILTNAAVKYNKPLFYYEDLYYGSFDKLFKELGLGYNEEYFHLYLNPSKKYRIGDTETKCKLSLI